MKRCPQCRQVWWIEEPTCPACGHVFRTNFLNPDAPVQTKPAPKSPRVSKTRRILLLGALLIGGALLVFLLLARRPRVPGGQTLALAARMKAARHATVLRFSEMFGRPAQITNSQIGPRRYLVWTYAAADGRVLVYFDSRSAEVAQVKAEAPSFGL